MNASEPTSAPSRFRQFSLRSLLGVILLCGIGLGLWTVYIAPYQRQRQLVEKIAELKGVATTEAVPTFWSRVFGDEFFINIVFIQLNDAKITDAWMSNLRDVPQLRELYLVSTPVGDAGLAHIASLEHLRLLSLVGTKTTDAGLAYLQGLNKLEELYLNQTQVTDEGLASLANLTALKELGLQGCPVGDTGLERLEGLSDLEGLNLRDTQVTDKGIASLSGLSMLSQLHLDNTDVTEACLADLKKLPQLMEVTTSGTNILPSALREAFPAFDEHRLAKKLTEPTVIEFTETPLTDVILYLKDYHRTEIWLNRQALREAGIREEVREHVSVTSKISQKPLHEALEQVLEPTGLKCIVRTGLLTVTTKTDAANKTPRLRLKPGEKLSRKLSQALYSPAVVEFFKTPLTHVSLYLSDYLKTDITIMEGTDAVDAAKLLVTQNLHGIPVADVLELIFYDLDVHGVIENNTIYLYRGPAPKRESNAQKG